MHLQTVLAYVQTDWRTSGHKVKWLALVLILFGIALQFIPISLSETKAIIRPGANVNFETISGGRETELSAKQGVPLLDHSVVNRNGIQLEPDPSSPMSPAYYHI